MKKDMNILQKDTCYFCTSPYQLFGILSIAQSRNEAADLYIDPQFSDAEVFAERIRTLNLFDNVVVIDSEKIYSKFFSCRKGFINHLQIVRSYLKVNEIAPIILKNNVAYNTMFISSRAYMPRMVYLYHIKNKIKVNLELFDDGVGSYCSDDAHKPKGLDSLLRFLLFGKRAVDLNFTRYLHSPELYKIVEPHSKYKIEKIPHMWKNPDWISKCNIIFGINDGSLINETVIIIDELLSDEVVSGDDSKNELLDIYAKISQTTGIKNTVIKPHPRNKDIDIEKLNIYHSNGVPFECVCMNSDINNKIIVSLGSTAAATPKILLDQEPYIILLYKLIDTNPNYLTVTNKFFQALKKSYTESAKIYIPDNISELCEILTRLCSEIGAEAKDE